MKFLDNKIPQVEFDNINTLILVGMSTEKAELAKVNGYGAISANDEASNFKYFLLYICPIQTKIRYGIR